MSSVPSILYPRRKMTSTSSELKNVVVIGCGLAGAGAINELMHSLPPNSHRIVAISATESAFYPIAALRGAVVKGEALMRRMCSYPPFFAD